MERTHSSLKKLPDVPGVYLFKKGRTVLYVGKATSLRDRVRSYFDDDLIAMRGPRVVDMVTAADRVAFETTPTVLEALVREAALIKQYLPKANVEGKDDKTFLYAVITKEKWPRVLTVRGKDLEHVLKPSSASLRVPLAHSVVAPVRLRSLASRASHLKVFEHTPISHVFGPFPSGPQLRQALRLIRRIFPFYDTPRPVTTWSKHMRAKIEFNRQIGHYPRVSFEALAKKGELDPKAYRRTIRNVALFLSGRATELRKSLKKQMSEAAREERFEDAAELRRELYALDHVQDVSLIKNDSSWTSDIHGRRGYPMSTGSRLEAYDTAHLAGTNAIGVMTVLVDGSPSKRDYRTFRIRGVQKNDDIASLKEVLIRRLAHPEWPLPDAIVVDGGKAQKKAAEEVLGESLKLSPDEIPVAAVVKDERHRPREILGARVAGISEADAVLANAEAHRFSLAKHRAARTRGLRAG